jgi:hypothetical protein
MATRQTALFACLFSMAFSANAHNYQCRVEGTYSVATGSFRFTKDDLKREHQTHTRRPCPLVGRDREDGRGNSEREAPERKTHIETLISDAPSAEQSKISPDFDPNMCGVVDGYHEASALIVRYCTKLAQPSRMVAIGKGKQEVSAQAASTAKQRPEIGFKVKRPKSYNAADHHQRFSINDGPLVGTCYVCIKIKDPSGSPVK